MSVQSHATLACGDFTESLGLYASVTICDVAFKQDGSDFYQALFVKNGNCSRFFFVRGADFLAYLVL